MPTNGKRVVQLMHRIEWHSAVLSTTKTRNFLFKKYPVAEALVDANELISELRALT